MLGALASSLTSCTCQQLDVVRGLLFRIGRDAPVEYGARLAPVEGHRAARPSQLPPENQSQEGRRYIPGVRTNRKRGGGIYPV
eukprot:1193844-Prorocentrum_minimum.AAC.2